MRKNYDCIVVGGGPGGCSAAALVAEQGHSTLLVEREKVPRFHVGESLMPETFWIFERLGVLDKMRSSDFVKKVSVQFVAHSGKESQPFFFKKHDPRECSTTWQVERADFDKMLFDNAAEKGADCLDQTRVQEVFFEDDRVTGARVETSEGNSHDIACRVIVDATGQSAMLANRLGIKEVDPELKKAAIWTYYRGAGRDPGVHGGATVILHTEGKDSWFWYIPLREDITSIGVVGDNDYLLKGRGSPENVYAEELEKCPNMLQRLSNAERTEKFHVAQEFSYRTTEHAGPGWVLIGDAFGFIDPIYSSGVYFALKSGELAADAIVDGFKTGDLSGEQLGRWCNEFKDGTQWIQKLVGAYYSNGFSFGRFMRDHPQHQGNLTDLLIGRIFQEGAGRIFDDMEPAVTETNEGRADPMSKPSR